NAALDCLRLDDRRHRRLDDAGDAPRGSNALRALELERAAGKCGPERPHQRLRRFLRVGEKVQIDLPRSVQVHAPLSQDPDELPVAGREAGQLLFDRFGNGDGKAALTRPARPQHADQPEDGDDRERGPDVHNVSAASLALSTLPVELRGSAAMSVTRRGYL